MKNKIRGGIAKRVGRSWALDKAQHLKELEAENAAKTAAGSVDDSVAAAGLMLLCNEHNEQENSHESKAGGTLAAEAQTGSNRGKAEQRCPSCHAVISTQQTAGPDQDSESPASVIAPWQWGRVTVCLCQAQTAGPNENTSPSTPHSQATAGGSSSPTATEARDVFRKPLPKTPHANSRLPPLPPRSSSRRGLGRSRHDADAAMELVEMREELLTDQRLIADLAHAALFPAFTEHVTFERSSLHRGASDRGGRAAAFQFAASAPVGSDQVVRARLSAVSGLRCAGSVLFVFVV
eukprot:CAMPEP_0202853316 /NCGR_PEP_ID=MMETSP1389-20130828/90420_1 /ASSEMBLY_ACC=CAM_ASM_000865 /TAXON_ID=302021 /ORGANISM="Rhodomonas sp., Strain CCMP768" /LENGTH=292 /DNA_ID=CAMNT_0049531865 /DNA_START=727 /DNA_END=1606 /DNA_ORIENTATION=+